MFDTIPEFPIEAPVALSSAGPIPPPNPPKAPPAAPSAPDPGDGMRRPTTTVKLTVDQNRKLTDRIKQRIAELKKEMGLNSDGTVMPDMFLAIRVRNEQTDNNDLRWRMTIDDSIFKEGHNLTLGTSKTHCKLMAASIREDLFGSKPFLGIFSDPATLQEEKTAELAKALEEYSQDQIDASNIPETLREAVRLALVRNEAVIKTTYETRTSTYYGPAEVAVDEGGLPIVTPEKGLYIFRLDDFVPDPNVEQMMRLEKDPSFEMPVGVELNWSQFDDLKQTEVLYDNVRSDILEPRDFLCPLHARDIYSADINVHIYDATEEELREKYGDDVVANTVLSSRSTTGAGQAKTVQGEEEWWNGSAVVKKRPMAEVYIRCAPETDGEEHEYIVDFDLTAEKIYWIGYLFDQFPCRPFHVLPGVQREPLRWYGIGIYSQMQHSSLFIDTQYNRANKRDSQSGVVRWYEKQAFEETANGQPLVIGDGNLMKSRPGYGDGTGQRAPVGMFNFSPEVSEITMSLMNMAIQQDNLQFGVISAAGASAVGMNNSRTATGIMNIERNGNLFVKDTENLHVECLEPMLEFAVVLRLQNMDDSQVIQTKDGLLVTLDREESRNLFKAGGKVKFKMTRSRSAEGIVMNKEAEACVLRYSQLTPPQQMVLRDFYIRELRFYEVDEPDKYLPEVTPEQAQAWQQAQAQQRDPAQQKLIENLNYKDTPEPIKRQIEQQAGFIPLTPQQQAKEQKNADAESQPKSNVVPMKKPNAA